MRIIPFMIKEIEIYKSLGEETRLRIMRILIKADVELCACEIIDVLEKPQYTISKSLGNLVKAGLIEENRNGRMMFYKLKSDDDFNRTLFENIKLIRCAASPVFQNDFTRLAERLALRKDGICVITCAPDL